MYKHKRATNKPRSEKSNARFYEQQLKKIGALTLQLNFWVEWKVNFPVFLGQKSKREGESRSKSSGENQEMMLSGEWRYNLSLIGWTWLASDTPPTYLLKKCFSFVSSTETAVSSYLSFRWKGTTGSKITLIKEVSATV